MRRFRLAITTLASSLTPLLVCLGLAIGGNVLPSRSLVETQVQPIQEDLKETATVSRRAVVSSMHHEPPNSSRSLWALVNDCARGRIGTPFSRNHAYREQTCRNGVGGPLLC